MANIDAADDSSSKRRLRHKFVLKTYVVTVIMLLLGEIQVIASMQSETLRTILKEHYYASLLQFFISFITIQLYVFFYHILEQKALWKRIICGVWTFESNTISIMKPAKTAPDVCLGASFILTFAIMGLSVCYGNIAESQRHGLFISRHNVIRWSEHLFVLISFGIIVSSEMRQPRLEFPTMLIYTLMSNAFVVVFAASMRKPNFYHEGSRSDYILIGQLYYINFYAMFMGYVWTIAAGINLYREINATG